MKEQSRYVLRTFIAIALSTASVASAQESQSTRTEEDSPLAEVVVTAQKREQRLQDVGISVTAIAAAELQNLNITTATDITRAVPSLRMNAYSSSQAVYNIRGISQNDYGDQQEPSVAVYQDDSYSSSINLASFPVFDLARVEVLRGPQGTLFGRNATGGAIQFISRKPTREFEGYTDLTIGSYNQFIIDGAVSGPITNQLQARLAFIRNKDDGYIESIVPGIPDRGGNDHYALRGSLAWQPNDSTDVSLITRYLRADKEGQAGLYSHEAGCPNANSQGEYLPATESCSYWGSPPGAIGSGYRNDSIMPSRGGDPWKTAETDPSYVDRKTVGSTLRVDSTVGNLDFVSVTDYQHSNKYYIEGGDTSPDEAIIVAQGSRLDQWSQEFRLAGELGSHQLVGGVFGMYVNGSYAGKFADPFYGYDPDVAFKQRTVSYAAFLQDEWQIADQWKLISGLRYWHDERQGSYFGRDIGGFTGVEIIFNENEIFPVLPGSSITTSDTTKKFDDVTARLELDYKPTDSMLLYLSYNRGSKSGGFTFSTGTPFPGAEQAFLEGIPFKPEVLNSYETGLKTDLGRFATLNLSAFYYAYDDYQAFAQVGPVQSIVNLNADAKGLEAELNARPLSGLTLQINASYLDSKVKNVLLPDRVTVVDHDLPQAPAFSGSALARYELQLGSGTASIQADAQYSDKFCFTVLCAPVEREGSYTVANARIGYAGSGDRWEIAAFVNNLFEEEYRVFAFDTSLFAGTVGGVYARPRTWGLTASYRFGAGYQ